MSKLSRSLKQIESVTAQALVAHGALPWIADEVARAVGQAEATGNRVCGLYYLESYCAQLDSGRVDGRVEPRIEVPKPSAVLCDAGFGFAQPAFARSLPTAVEIARKNGNCVLAICHAHTCTALGYFTGQIAAQGLIGIGATNAPACVAPPGGKHGVLGTNPIAMSVPAEDEGTAFQFDQSTSAIAIGKIRMAAASGEKIPLGWAVDSKGQSTDDPALALEGSLLSAGGYKGYGFGLMAEILAAAVTGSLSSIDAPPLKTAQGPPHNLGQFYFLLDPTTFSGASFWSHVQQLQEAVAGQPGARLPGSQPIKTDSVEIDAALWDAVIKLASPNT